MDNLQQTFIRFVRDAFCQTIVIRGLVFPSELSVTDRALHAANTRICLMMQNLTAAKLMLAEHEILDHVEIDDLFSLFSLFADEFLNDYGTQHSFQQLDDVFERLKNAFENSIFSSQV